MKNLMVIMLAILMSGALSAQNVIEKNFKNYQQQENFTTISVTGKMFELASYIDVEGEDEDLQELKELVASIRAFNMIVGSEVEASKSKYKTALSKVERSHEELLSVEDKEGNFKFFIDERNGVVKELVMVGMTDMELMIFSLEGEMDLRKLGKMTKKIQSGGFEEMGMIFDHGVDKVKVYPNPAPANSQINAEIPAEMIGGKATIFNMKGASVKNYDIADELQIMDSDGLPSGTYVVEFKKDNISIKRKIIIQDN